MHVIVWGENDDLDAPSGVMTIETNYARNGRNSGVPYNHYSLLRSIEAGFGLPCLNHACDATSKG